LLLTKRILKLDLNPSLNIIYHGVVAETTASMRSQLCIINSNSLIPPKGTRSKIVLLIPIMVD